jgi:PAS domain S-box-containing protein
MATPTRLSKGRRSLPQAGGVEKTNRILGDEESFQAVRKHVLSQLISRRRRRERIRIWVPGCSTGEEVYSIALLLKKEMGQHATSVNIQIFGTDANSDDVEYARAGVYPEAVFSALDSTEFELYVSKTEQGYRVNDVIRDLCVFARHDLAKDPPLSKMDLVSSRNVMSGMPADLRSRTATLFQYALKPGGFLFLGRSETFREGAGVFAPINARHRIFARRADAEMSPKDLRALFATYETQRLRSATGKATNGEDLQIKNEELETAKEELQASLEELISLNDELVHRNSELKETTTELTTLVARLQIPLILLDANSRIRRFTPLAAKVLHLGPNDVGCPFTDVASGLNVVDWQALLSRVSRRGLSVEREISDEHGHRYSLRIRPYLRTDNKTHGVFIVLLDTHLIHKALDQARQSAAFARAIVETAHEALVVIDPSLRVLSANRSFCDLFRVSSKAAKGRSLIGARKGQLNIPELEPLLKDVFTSGKEIKSFEIDRQFRVIGRRCLVLNARQLSATSSVLIAIENVTAAKEGHEQTQKAEATVRALLESSPQSIIAVNEKGHVILANRKTEEMFGYKLSEIIGQPLDPLVPQNSRGLHEVRHRNYFQEGKSRRMGLGLELEARRKDGSLFPVEIGLSLIKTSTERLGVAFVNDVTERKRLEQTERKSAEEIRALAAKLLTAQEDERRRVSLQLHDNICQELASLAIDIGALADRTQAPDSSAKLKEIQARAVHASEQTRHIAYELYPSVLDDLGLVASMRELCKNVSERHDLAIEFMSGLLPSFLSREIAACFYRVAREALNNVVQHARAKQVSVALSFGKGKLLLSVADDGVGFEPEVVQGNGALGLLGMAERARVVNGSLSIASKRGKGTRIGLQVPMFPVIS